MDCETTKPLELGEGTDLELLLEAAGWAHHTRRRSRRRPAAAPAGPCSASFILLQLLPLSPSPFQPPLPPPHRTREGGDGNTAPFPLFAGEDVPAAAALYRPWTNNYPGSYLSAADYRAKRAGCKWQSDGRRPADYMFYPDDSTCVLICAV